MTLSIKVRGLAVVLVIAAAAVAPASAASTAIAAASSGKPVMRVLVMGDSYSAGNGAGDYYGPKGCWRSHRNYAELFADGLRAAPNDQPTSVTNVACSGAVTADIENQRSGRPPEIEAVSDTDNLVLLTIGGNDIYFADIVKFCLIAKFRNGATCNANLSRAEALLDNGTVKSRIRGVLQDIAGDDPDGTVVLLGYPLLEGDPHYTLRSGHVVGPVIQVGKRVRALGRMGDAIDRSVVASLNSGSSSAHFVFVSVQKLFNGPPFHGLYAKRNNPDRWMNQPFVDASFGASHDTWYHPNPEGWQQEAQLLLSDADVPKSPPPSSAPLPPAHGWPTHRQDGSPAYYAYLGASFIFPDWSSCDSTYCLAGSGDTVYIFTEHPLNQIGEVPEATSDPAAELESFGLPAADVQSLLASSG
jgi:lysophospholipase L1-like esterase